MITGVALTYQLDEKTTVPCEDFSFQSGVTYISYDAKKDIFSALVPLLRPFRGADPCPSMGGDVLTPTRFHWRNRQSDQAATVKKHRVLNLSGCFLGKRRRIAKAFSKLSLAIKGGSNSPPNRGRQETETGDLLKDCLVPLIRSPISDCRPQWSPDPGESGSLWEFNVLRL